MSSVPLLEFRDLACERDGWWIFKGLSGQLCAGDVLQIAGPNGSGKTTLLGILNTSLNPSAGELLWRGRAVATALATYRANLLYLGHLAGVKIALTPNENLRWFVSLHATRAERSVAGALRHVGLADLQDEPCHKLSAGQVRRVALARLWLAAAQVWLLDEPMTAIDSAGIGELEALFAGHCAEGGMVLFTSHQEVRVTGVQKLELTEGRRCRD